MYLIKLKQVHFIVVLTFLGNINSDTNCGDWESYKDEKCFKVLDNLFGEEVSESLCIQQEKDSTLLTIHSKEEQEFLEKLLFTTHKIVDNVWIGLKYNTKFSWIDNTQLDYTNWDSKSPKNNKSDGCVRIMGEEGSVGKWSDVACNKSNRVVCEKMQTWSNVRLQKEILQYKRDKEVLDKQLIQIKKENENFEQNINQKLITETNTLIPIGFTYVQLPKEKSPQDIWPSMKWTDISSTYDGVFFRVIGKNTETFGSVQNENIPAHYIDQIQNPWLSKDISIINLNASGWSDQVWTGSDSGKGIALIFHTITTTGEVRPRNMAVKIWKRTG